ncbi:RES domain-containing protein [Planctobacterium marinum]|uniref:RES domain-containing protein n=1 Tax=Planctobacterium marinum TaxID=1631968 RepID=UPI001E3619B1|nr:RES domain-containing protein [Planctobacterium marinum]MCC2605610.1 RES domain-containing protein [Planctobacterium marinum]
MDSQQGFNMGYWSDLAISQGESEHFESKNTHVCSNCVVDEYLGALVLNNAVSPICDYCGRNDGMVIAAKFETVMDVVYEAIQTKYADAQDINVPWAEGAWITPEIYSPDVVGYVDPGWSVNFLEDVINALSPFVYWTEHADGDWSSMDKASALSYGWERFKLQVLFHTRYFFQSHEDDEYEAMRSDFLPVNQMMSVLGKLCLSNQMITTVDPGTSFYRVRVSQDKELYTDFDQVGVPPIDNTGAGRMNPSGIPYFYLGFEQETAIAETLSTSTHYCMATFTNSAPIKVIDLTSRPDIPSIFDVNNAEKRHDLMFLEGFVNDITKPVAKDKREHTEYVPTQVVSEYFRHVFLDNENSRIDGIVYPSAKSSTGTNIAIFKSDNKELQSIFELIDVSLYEYKN